MAKYGDNPLQWYEQNFKTRCGKRLRPLMRIFLSFVESVMRHLLFKVCHASSSINGLSCYFRDLSRNGSLRQPDNDQRVSEFRLNRFGEDCVSVLSSTDCRSTGQCLQRFCQVLMRSSFNELTGLVDQWRSPPSHPKEFFTSGCSVLSWRQSSPELRCAEWSVVQCPGGTSFTPLSHHLSSIYKIQTLCHLKTVPCL